MKEGETNGTCSMHGNDGNACSSFIVKATYVINVCNFSGVSANCKIYICVYIYIYKVMIFTVISNRMSC